MWPDFVVVFSPFINNLPGFFQRSEPVLIQTSIPELAIEAFNKGILGWLAGLDDLQPDLVVSVPEEHGFRGGLSTIVKGGALRFVSLYHQLFPKPGYPEATDR